MRTFIVIALLGAATFPGSPLGHASTLTQWLAFAGFTLLLTAALWRDLTKYDERRDIRQRILERLNK